jgi:putative component of toxin-antitoxin plasmid stabilization module
LAVDVYEMREFFGCGWRMYYLQQGKKTQSADIKRAKQVANELRS